MKAWCFDFCGVRYWVAAPDMKAAIIAFIALDDCPLEDESGLEISEIGPVRAAETRIKDDEHPRGGLSLHEIVAATKTPTVVACSEWP